MLTARTSDGVNFAELHQLLSVEFGLVPDSSERGTGRSYFWKKVIWSPAVTTRIVRVQYDEQQIVTRIRLCVSSDNNNSVFLPPPFDLNRLRIALAEEILLLQRRQPQHIM